MDFTNFAEMVKDEVEKTAGSNFQISLNDVSKNNGIILKGITIVENENNIAPTIYLNDYYQDYINGRTTFELSAAFDTIKAVINELDYHQSVLKGREPENVALPQSAYI